MLVQVLAAALLLLGSGLVFYALLEMEGRPRSVRRPEARPAPPGNRLPRAA